MKYLNPGLIPIYIGLLVAGPAHAASTVYTDQAAFTDVAGSVTFDSFEDLASEINSPVAAIERTGYTISSSLHSADEGLYVFDFDSGFGAFATNGDTYLVHQTDAFERLRFDFDAPINSFGISITDWDSPLLTDGAELLFGNDAGDKVVVTAASQLDGESLFFGIINAEFAFTYVEFGNGTNNEAYGFDGVYFGSPVPVPAAVWLLVGGLAALTPLRRRQENGSSS
ncbi:MAG: VPLPA-CTERM sorting domain-containing protein [Gammaproteobacteria bacterium]